MLEGEMFFDINLLNNIKLIVFSIRNFICNKFRTEGYFTDFTSHNTLCMFYAQTIVHM